MAVHGTVDSSYTEVRDAFAKMLADQPGDPAAQLVAYQRDRIVADLWSSAAGDGDALTGVFSATKGATHLVIARLVRDRVLHLDRPVVAYWPEFTSDLTLRDLLAHRSGLIGVDGGFTSAELADDRILADRLLRQQPFWRPGSTYGYHAFVIGALLGAVAERATGRTIQQLFTDLVRTPFAVEVFLGSPDESRYRPVLPAPQKAELPPDSLIGVAFNLNADPPTDLAEWINIPSVRALGQSSAAGVASARGLAKMYAAAVWGVDGAEPLLDRDTLTTFATVSSPGTDVVTGEPGHFGLGFETQTHYRGLSPIAFGHSGAAGSHAFADPRTGIAYAYTRRRFAFPGGAAPENADLIEAVVRSAGR
ncbi:beta-lactamase family protein [Actinoplanes sp. NBC_00393]|uniref:serine hydrolase domain-containing protein n=1 Tax=Actinoplanes sp. NBC_00393 TaxID=2975953 RepID=UPI002E235ABE